MSLKSLMTDTKNCASMFVERLNEFFAAPTNTELQLLTGLNQTQRQEIATSWAKAYQGCSLQVQARQLRKSQRAMLQQKRFAKATHGEAQ